MAAEVPTHIITGHRAARIARRHLVWLIPILLVSLLPRIYWATAYTAVIENEGAVYASLGESLRSGKGYVSIFGMDVTTSPLYPILIASLLPLAGEAERAARFVSVIASTLVAVPTYLVALTLYGPVTARIAAILIALHPLLIGYSATVYSEPTYLLFLMMGVYCALRAQELHSHTWSVLAGVVFGLAYLMRVEGLMLLLATVPLLLVINWRRPGRAAVAAGVLFASFLVVAAPYIAFLWAKTGTFRFEAKGAVFFVVLHRMMSGLSYLEAAYGLSSDLREGGPFLQPWLSVIQSTSYSLADVLRYLAATGRPRLISIFTALTDRRFGSLLLVVLVVLGLLRSSWDRARLAREALVLAIFASVVGSYLMVQWLPTRYLLVPLALLLVWAAKGIQELAAWAQDTLRSLLGGRVDATAMTSAAQALSIAALLLVALTVARQEPDLTEGFTAARATKEAGVWLRHKSPGPKTIMDVGSVFAYYAGGTQLYLPYCDGATALRYFAKKRPDFIILSSRASALRPYLRTWILTGIPDTRAALVYSQPEPEGGRIVVYHWQP
jgi:4-amino-4-deoxy-L-arabinose transferase-like glycosyltransferase